MSEPLYITTEIKEKFGKLFPVIEYQGTFEGKPAYLVSQQPKDANNQLTTPASYLIVDPTNFNKSEIVVNPDLAQKIVADSSPEEYTVQVFNSFIPPLSPKEIEEARRKEEEEAYVNQPDPVTTAEEIMAHLTNAHLRS